MRALLAAMLDIDRQRYRLARRGYERIRDMAEIAGDQRKQIGRLLVGIAPDREVTAGRSRFAPHTVGRKHVRPVEEIGDAAKALRLALRAIGGARAIEAHELGVGRRIEARLDRERERASGWPSQHEARRARFELGLVDRLAVQSCRNERELITI